MSGTVVALICPKHGFSASSICPHCEKEVAKTTLHINTYDWIKDGVWEHIDPAQPNLKIESKEQLKVECEKRGLIPKALMKPKSQGRGWEIAKR